MNITQIHEIMAIADGASNNSLTPADDLRMAYEYISRNPNLIRDYPSLEEALKLLQRVIEHEESDRTKK